jgi:hypothetical protein
VSLHPLADLLLPRAFFAGLKKRMLELSENEGDHRKEQELRQRYSEISWLAQTTSGLNWLPNPFQAPSELYHALIAGSNDAGLATGEAIT